MMEATIPVGDHEQLVLLLGPADQNLRQIREAVPAKVSTRDGQIHLSGKESAVLHAVSIFEQLKAAVEQDGSAGPEVVAEIVSEVTGQNGAGASGETRPARIEVQRNGVSIRPRTEGQARYVEAIRDNALVFCVGPAGSGKTYLAVATAVEALKQGAVNKIVLVRPAVEAGESLGYLPGDLLQKINPYLRPLLDAIGEMTDYDQLKRYMSEQVIEVAPLAYMRGRTLNGAFVILDEAQNTTASQMKMFLTRMGAESKVVVSGDATQVDLPGHTRSGLADAMRRLRGIDGIAEVKLTGKDIVRHRLVQEIVNAYDQ